MLPINDQVLKEWALVCHALGTGQQIFIARKGGIAETTSRFEVQNREFFLTPTYTHETKKFIQPKFHALFDSLSAEEPPINQLLLTHYAVVTDILKITSPEPLTQLGAHSIWNQNLLLDRFHWGKKTGLTVLILRAYRLKEIVTCPMTPAYRGCKSWLTLETPVPVKLQEPACSNPAFEKMRETLLRAESPVKCLG